MTAAKPPRPPPEDDASDQFRRAVADVRPLRTTPRVPSPRPSLRRSRTRQDATLAENVAGAAPAGIVAGGDEALAFRRTWLQADVLRRLQRGEFPIEADLDLHGLGRDAARLALREFVAEAVAHRWRCVRVIHGKGLRSGPDGPVLRHLVDHWLRRVDEVAAFASARPPDGGSGATCVLLGRRP
jgi:DNA-nicking Smr family endonuclease